MVLISRLVEFSLNIILTKYSAFIFILYRYLWVSFWIFRYLTLLRLLTFSLIQILICIKENLNSKIYEY